MSDWKEVLNDSDINDLLDSYAGFHDSCIVSLNYQSGINVDETTMHFNGIDGFTLNMIFHSVWSDKALELCFTGLRRLHLVGAQDNYVNDIYGASIKFYDGILPSEYAAPERVVVWADSEEFDAKDIDHKLCEPDDVYVIAHALKWRFVDK